jgi:hypothetical protein
MNALCRAALAACIAAPFALASPASAQQAPAEAARPAAITGILCIKGIEGPSQRPERRGCFEPAAMELRHDRRGRELTAALPPRELELILRAGGPGAVYDEVMVCIINGANICFEGPYEFVWVCITTGMLAGSTCPSPPETGLATLGLASFQRP